MTELRFGQGLDLDRASLHDFYRSAHTVRNYLIKRWDATLDAMKSTPVMAVLQLVIQEAVVYLSAEFLLGR
ncbi:MAG: hypothetical protein LBP35_02465 [Candidatus Ancillula trichonymphae]|nr:hypothetical protein [Candidatus Ancillula trichonymphae]